MISKNVMKIMKEKMTYPFAREYNVRSKMINLASNENPYGPSPRVIKRLREELKKIGTYPDPKATELKEEISRYIKVDEECIALGNGSDELMDLACRAFMDPGCTVLIPIPTFAMYGISCRANGCIPKFLKLPGFTWNPDLLKRELNDARAAFLGRPNNPTGASLSKYEVISLVETGKMLIVDEAYIEFGGESVAGIAPEYDNLLVLRTLSKAFGLAGLRVGYAIGNPKLIRAIESIKAPFNVNRLAQSAAVEALRDREYLKRVVKYVKKERRYLSGAIEKIGAKVLPSDGNFIMVNTRAFGISGAELCNLLARNGILIRELTDFKGAGVDWVRITVGKPEQNRRLIRAMKKIMEGRR